MIFVKKLSEDRWREYRDFRLEALKNEPIAFGSSYDEEKSLSEEEWRKRIKNVLFAVSKGKLVGMIVYVRNNKIKTRHIANIYGVYVIKEYRAQGVGKKLMNSALAQIQKSKGIAKISLTVNPEQKAAVKLYQSYGFEVVGRSKKELFIDGKFYDELIMEKLL